MVPSRGRRTPRVGLLINMDHTLLPHRVRARPAPEPGGARRHLRGPGPGAERRHSCRARWHRPLGRATRAGHRDRRGGAAPGRRGGAVDEQMATRSAHGSRRRFRSTRIARSVSRPVGITDPRHADLPERGGCGRGRRRGRSRHHLHRVRLPPLVPARLLLRGVGAERRSRHLPREGPGPDILVTVVADKAGTVTASSPQPLPSPSS